MDRVVHRLPLTTAIPNLEDPAYDMWTEQFTKARAARCFGERKSPDPVSRSLPPRLAAASTRPSCPCARNISNAKVLFLRK